MKYAHVGIVDQAKAVAKLPAPGNGALHGRGISGGVRVIRRHPVAKPTNRRKAKTPAVSDRGFGIKRRHLAKGGKVEAAGIEPASCDPLMSASTCVVRRLMSPETGSANKAWLKPATTKSRVGRSGVGRRQPEFATDLRTPQAGIPQSGLT